MKKKNDDTVMIAIIVIGAAGVFLWYLFSSFWVIAVIAALGGIGWIVSKLKSKDEED